MIDISPCENDNTFVADNIKPCDIDNPYSLRKFLLNKVDRMNAITRMNLLKVLLISPKGDHKLFLLRLILQKKMMDK